MDSTVEEHRGFVKLYGTAKGYGFLVRDNGGWDVFLHANVLNRAGLGAVEPVSRACVTIDHGSGSR